ncbi:acyltransferase family protein [Agromyces bauzanensis]
MEAHGRRHWMDALRGVAVLLVASWHAFSTLYDSMPVAIEWIFNFLSVYRIPLLLFLSGLLLDQSVRKGAGAYVVGKLRRIAWPLIIWSALLVLIGWPAAKPFDGWYWLGEGGYLWYLGVLLACYAIGLITKFVHPLIILGVGTILMEVVDTEIAFVTNVLWFGLYFFAGATLSRWLDRWLRMGPLVPSLLVSASLAWAAYSATVNGYAPVLHWRPLLLSIIGVVGVVWFASRLRRVRWMEWIGQRSIVFYVAHVPFIYLTSRLLGEAVPEWVGCLVGHVVMFGGCLMLARFLDRSILFEFPWVPSLRGRSAAEGRSRDPNPRRGSNPEPRLDAAGTTEPERT